MQIVAVIAAAVVALFIGKFAFRLMFEDSDDFWECVRFSFTPDLLSLFRGEYFQDMAKSFKLTLFMIVTLGAGGLTYFGLDGIGHFEDTGSQLDDEDGRSSLPAERPE